jgi:rhomboid protease GluP
MGGTPWLTLAVFAVTSAVTGLMLAWPELGMAQALMRTPTMLDGEPWRLVTSWFVLTDGWGQIVGNSVALLVVGSLVEWRIGRGWWLAGYVTGGLVGEIAGSFWQPVGGGNSVAILGLMGLLAAALARRRGLSTLRRWLPALIWIGLAIWLCWRADIHGPPIFAGLCVGLLWLARGREVRGVPA